MTSRRGDIPNVYLHQSKFWNEVSIRGGVAFRSGTIRSFEKLANLLGEPILDLEQIADLLRNEKSSFALISESESHIIVCVDRVRSIPLFLCQTDNHVCVTNDSRKALESVKNPQVNWESVSQFIMSGYVHGDSTLYKGVTSLSAGTLVCINKSDWNISYTSYFIYLPQPAKEYKHEHLVQEFGEIIDKAIDRTIEIANGRPIWVALSGGLDSRLVLAKLREKNYPDLHCFTYGIGGNHEILLARRTAELLGVSWRFIRSNLKELRQLYNSQDRKNYSDYADGLSMVPVYVEYEAFLRIARDNMFPEDSVIVNGQSGDYLFGGHVPPTLYSVDRLDSVVQYIVEKHCMHWPELLDIDHEHEIYQTVVRKLRQLRPRSNHYDRDTLLAMYESWEWSERQPKATVNNQRLYEYFGFDWILPLWDSDLIDFWAKVPYEEKFNQSLQQDYLRQYNYRGVFDRGRAPSRAFVANYYSIVWLARSLGLIGGRAWKDRFYEYMFYYSYFRPQLGLFGRQFYIQNYQKTRRPRVVAFGARLRLHELGILGIKIENL